MPLSLYLWIIFFGASASSFSVLPLTPTYTRNSVIHTTTIQNGERAIMPTLEQSELNAANGENETPLLLAEKGGHDEVAVLLKEKIAILTARLMEAAKTGELEEVKTLIQRGADINYIGNDEDLAARGLNLDTVKHRGRRNAEVDSKNKDGMTPLMMAARWGHLATVKILLGRGADLNIEDNNGKTALSLAIEHNHTEVVKFLKEQEKISAATLRLIIGAATGKLDEVKSAIATGADIERNMAPEEGYLKQTPLVWASGAGHIDVVKYLVERGTKVNPKDVSWTALHVAAQMGQLNVVKFLVDSGADVNDRVNTKGMSPIYIAAQNCHLPTVKFLMDKGAVIGLRDDYFHWTPLYAAASNGCFDVVKHLVESGAEINLKDKLGHTSLYLANCKYYKERLQDYSKIIDYLTSRGATIYGMEPNEKGCCFTVVE